MTFDIKMRTFGATDMQIGALGLGTWAMGGVWTATQDAHYLPGTAMGYGPQSDDDSRAVIDAALDHGVKLIDTANLYGAGHAERLLGDVLKGRRHKAFIATRFGHSYDPGNKTFTGVDTSPSAIRSSLEATLQNLQTDYVDIFQLQVEFHTLIQIDDIFDVVERLIEEGKVRYTGWSTNYPARLQAIARRDSVQSAQFDLNVFQDAPDMLEVCEAANLTAIARLPLAMGFLTGKFTAGTTLPPDDVRASYVSTNTARGGTNQNRFWLRYFKEGGAGKGEWTERLDEVRSVLTEDGKTSLAQGALRWIFARYPKTVAIPGARTVEQFEENFGAIEHGPLSDTTMAEIERILKRDDYPAELYLRPHRPAS